MADTGAASAVPSSTASPKEDAATKSAREELKHTAISEKQETEEKEGSQSGDKADDSKRRAATPDNTSVQLKHDVLTEQISSPKKKRAHDEVDDEEYNKGSKKNKDEQSGDDAGAAAPPASAAGLGVSNGGDSGRAEPEKKRLRDETASDAENSNTSSGSATKDKKQATAPTSAFASSGFAKLANSTSPFGALSGGSSGANAKPSLFGSAASSASPFGSLGASSTSKPSTTSTTSSTAPPAPALTSPPTLSFGSSGSASPFASLQGSAPSTKVFGGSFGSSATGLSSGFGSIGGGNIGGGGFGNAAGAAKTSAFGSALSGSKLTSFSKPGEAFKSDKPARPFGAPESDPDDSGDDDSAAEEDENGDEGGDAEGGVTEERAKVGVEEKKKRLQRVVVDDGEAGEATLLQVRARMYYLDKDLGSWKERGAGMLKVNVPEHCVEFDQDGSVIPASFDASTLTGGDDDDDADGSAEAASDDADNKSEKDASSAKKGGAGGGAAALPKRNVVRLIMRQDSTHRVILNTIVMPSTEFKDRQTLKATTVLFTAFEGEDAKPVSVQAKMNIANAKTFMSAMEGIQKELRGD